jgi:hypothetical protein
MSAEKIIFSMERVSKIYPPQKKVSERYLPLIFLRSQRSEYLGLTAQVKAPFSE